MQPCGTAQPDYWAQPHAPHIARNLPRRTRASARSQPASHARSCEQRPGSGADFLSFRATERHSCRPSEALHGPPDGSMCLPGAVCWPGTISASTNTRTGGEHRVKNATMLAPGAIAHARGVEWQDFGRSGAHSERPAVDDAVPWRALAACRMTEAGPNRGRSCHTTYSGGRAVHASGGHPWSS